MGSEKAITQKRKQINRLLCDDYLQVRYAHVVASAVLHDMDALVDLVRPQSIEHRRVDSRINWQVVVVLHMILQLDRDRTQFVHHVILEEGRV